MKTLPIILPVDAIATFCAQNGISHLSLFGSILREDFTPQSDVDFLVEFVPEFTPGMMGMARLERELTNLIGRKADIRTKNELSRYFVDYVLKIAEPIYAA